MGPTSGSTGENLIDANLGRLARYKGNVKQTGNTATFPPSESGTAIVGSYSPNAWGLYDMHGNICEFCLDVLKYDITDLNGEVNTSTVDKPGYVVRGGGFGRVANQARSAYREVSSYRDATSDYGFRVACPVGIE